MQRARGRRSSPGGARLGSVAVSAVVAGGALVGCDTSTAPDEASAGLRFSAVAVQEREDAAVGGRFQVKLTNTGTTTVTVVTTALDSRAFESLPPTRQDYAYRPGQRTDLPTPYGRARCEPGVDAARFWVRLTVARPGAPRTVEVRVPLESRDATLTRIHDDECAKRALAEAVDVRLTDVAPAGGRSVAATLEVRRRAAQGQVTVHGVAGSVLYDVLPATRTLLPARLDPSGDVLRVPLRIRMASCDPHVIGETKKPYLFPVWISTGAAAPQYSAIPVSEEQRSVLVTLLATVCEPAP